MSDFRAWLDAKLAECDKRRDKDFLVEDFEDCWKAARQQSARATAELEQVLRDAERKRGMSEKGFPELRTVCAQIKHMISENQRLLEALQEVVRTATLYLHEDAGRLEEEALLKALGAARTELRR